MPYSFGLILLTVSLLLQGWSEKYDRTNNQIFASMIVAKYREKQGNRGKAKENVMCKRQKQWGDINDCGNEKRCRFVSYQRK